MKHIYFSFLFLLLPLWGTAQISQGGSPYTLSSRLKSGWQIPKVTLPRINNDSLIRHDLEREDNRNGLPFAFDFAKK